MQGRNIRLWVISFVLGAILALPGASSWASGAAPSHLETTTRVVVYQTEPTLTPVAVVTEPGTGVENPVTQEPIDIDAQIALWLVILGFITSMLASVLSRRAFSPEARAGITLAVALLVAVVDTFVRGTLNLTNLTATVLLVLASAVTFYRQFSGPSGLANALSGGNPTVAK